MKRKIFDAKNFFIDINLYIFVTKFNQQV
jgi:hypothetical protein